MTIILEVISTSTRGATDISQKTTQSFSQGTSPNEVLYSFISKSILSSLLFCRTCNIGTNTLIGSSTKVSENVCLTASVIGQGCNIGAGSRISGSYIFEGAVIGERCIIERSIIGAGVQVKNGSRIPKGCLLADGVIIGPDASLQPFERLSVSRDGEDGDSEDEAEEDSDIEEVEASKFLFFQFPHSYYHYSILLPFYKSVSV